MDRFGITRRRLLAVLGVGSTGLLAACGQAARPAAVPGETAAGSPAPGAHPGATEKPAAAAAPGKPEGNAAGNVFWLVRPLPQENRAQEAVFEPMLKERLPDVRIERVITSEYIPKINSMAAARESLEIWGFGGNYVDYWARGLAQDLTGYIKGDNWDVDSYFQQGLMDVFKVKGKYYGVAQLTTFGSIAAYNKDLLKAAGLPNLPVTWDDASWTVDKLFEYSTRISKNVGGPDATYGLHLGLWSRITSLPYLWGGDAWRPEHYANGIAPRTNFDSYEVIDSHQYLQDLTWKHKVSPDPGALQAMQALQSPFKTGRIGVTLDGGWLFWTLSDIKEFKLGYAALPRQKSNKHINFDDFWIIGRWAQNKDAAWQVLRVITSVDATSRYSVQSGTPPTPRGSLKPWLEAVSKYADMSVEDLTTLTTGAVDPKIAQESPDHLFLQYPKIENAYQNTILDPILNNQGTAKDIISGKGVQTLDEIVKGIHEQFKDTLPKD